MIIVYVLPGHVGDVVRAKMGVVLPSYVGG